MSKSRACQFLFALVAIVCAAISPAHALNFVSYVSGVGDDGNDCSRAHPCLSFIHAISQTAPGGQISVVDAGTFGPVMITQSLTIVNDTTGTATACCSVFPLGGGTIAAEIVIAAGPSDVVTLRGLAFNQSGNVFPGSTSVVIQNARQVNIERCTIRNQTGTGILMIPSSSGQLASSINLNIEDTIITGNAAGAKITSVPGLPVNVSIFRSSVKSNSGGGIRIDGTSGGPIKAAISESDISLNASNGVVALSGPSGNVTVNVNHSVIASNGLYGVQSNQTSGGSATVTVESSKITNNVSGQVGFFGGGALLTAGNNLLAGGNGTGFSGAIPLQ